MSNSAATGRPGRSASISTTARCFGADSSTGPFSDRTSSGPRSATSTGPNIRRPICAFLVRPHSALPKVRRSYTAPIPALPGCNQGATVEAEPEQQRLRDEAAAKQASPTTKAPNE